MLATDSKQKQKRSSVFLTGLRAVVYALVNTAILVINGAFVATSRKKPVLLWSKLTRALQHGASFF